MKTTNRTLNLEPRTLNLEQKTSPLRSRGLRSRFNVQSSRFKVFVIGSVCSSLLALASLAAEPLRALLVTGGCCHDYAAQKKILTEGISARANVAWTIIHEGDGSDKDVKFSIYEKPDWTK